MLYYHQTVDPRELSTEMMKSEENKITLRWEKIALCFPTMVGPLFLYPKIGVLYFFPVDSLSVCKSLVISHEKEEYPWTLNNDGPQISKEYIVQDRFFHGAVI